MSNRTRDYKRFDYKYPLVLSASQLTTFAGETWDPVKGVMKEGCERKWAFEKLWKLPREQKGYFDFGEVLHEACERWLEADETGRNEDGTPLDLWPEGWDAKLSFADSALIQALVEKAIEEGMLRRSAGREIEPPIQMPVIKGEATMIGYVDVLLPDGVEDHKSTSNMRYAKSQEGLANNTQLLVYAAYIVRQWMKKHKTLKGLEFITLRHNVFLKDQEKPLIRPTQAQVPPDHVVAFWDRVVIPSAQKMLHWKRSGLPITDWDKIPGATDKGTCRKYGGCAFASICTRRETPAAYTKRITRLIENSAPQDETPMPLFDKLKSKGAKPKAPADVPAQETKTSNKAKKEPEYEEVPDEESPAEEPKAHDPGVAPWANPDCRACKGKGLSSKGAVCKACEAHNGRQDDPLDMSSYELKAGEGFIDIFQGEELVSSVIVTAAVASKDATTPKTKTKTKTKAKAAAEKQPEEPKKVEEAVKAPKGKAEVKTPAKKGRPRKGFTLLYGSARLTKRDTVNLAEVLSKYGEQLAESLQARNYFALNAFQRRDALASKAQIIAEDFGTSLVFVRPGNPDLDALAAALEPFAFEILEGGN